MSALNLSITGVKFLIGILLTFYSCVYRLPLIVVGSVAWYIWLMLRLPDRKQKLTATSGLSFTTVGWCISWFERYYGIKVEACHSPGQADEWMLLSNLSFLVGSGAMLLGLLALAYVDAFRTLLMQPSFAEPNEPELHQDQVWPPAPKQP